MFFDADASIADLFDADGCDNPLFIFDLFESSTDSMLVDLPAATAALLLDDVIPEHHGEETEDHTAIVLAEEKEKEQNGNHSFIPMKRRKSELINSYQYATDSSSSTRGRDQSLSRTTTATTNDKNITTISSSTMNKVTAPAVSIVLSLLTPEQLEQQLEHTKNRLAEFMKRSTTSRKRLNDQVDFKYQDYLPSIISQPDSAIDCPPQQEVISSSCQSPAAARTHRFKGSNSTAIPTSTALSQSRAQFASFVNNRMNIASLTL
eukprot:scaffold7864_cov158-Chaetoceros_neogracile.AAC.1